jgi:mono/diheme cytochrome c family protein
MGGFAALLVLPACSDGGGGSDVDLVAQGATVYGNVCTTCHNADPTKDGSVGPAIAGSSMELLEARVVRAEYPEGYAPKRDSAVMPAFPYLEPQIPALHAFLADAAAKEAAKN